MADQAQAPAGRYYFEGVSKKGAVVDDPNDPNWGLPVAAAAPSTGVVDDPNDPNWGLPAAAPAPTEAPADTIKRLWEEEGKYKAANFEAWVKGGPHRVWEGIKRLGGGMEAGDWRGEVPAGLHDIVVGSGITALPMVGVGPAAAAFTAAPVATTAAVGGGMALGYGGAQLAEAGAKKIGLTEPEQALVGDVGGLAGGWLGAKVGPAVAGVGAGYYNAWKQARAVQLGKQVVTDLTNLAPRTVSHNYEPEALQNRVVPRLAVEDAKNPVTDVAGALEATDNAIHGMDAEFRQAVDQYGQMRVPNPITAAWLKLSRSSRTDALVRGFRELSNFKGLTRPTLTVQRAVELIGQFNAENKSTLANNAYDLATVRKTNPEFVAREAAVASLRADVYDLMARQGIPGVAEFRKDQGALIAFRNALFPRTLSPESTVMRTGTESTVRKAVAAGVKYAATAAGAEAGSLVPLPLSTAAGAGVGLKAGQAAAEAIAPGNLTRDALAARAFANIRKLNLAEPFTLPAGMPPPAGAAGAGQPFRGGGGPTGGPSAGRAPGGAGAPPPPPGPGAGPQGWYEWGRAHGVPPRWWAREGWTGGVGGEATATPVPPRSAYTWEWANRRTKLPPGGESPATGWTDAEATVVEPPPPPPRRAVTTGVRGKVLEALRRLEQAPHPDSADHKAVLAELEQLATAHPRDVGDFVDEYLQAIERGESVSVGESATSATTPVPTTAPGKLPYGDWKAAYDAARANQQTYKGSTVGAQVVAKILTDLERKYPEHVQQYAEDQAAATKQSSFDKLSQQIGALEKKLTATDVSDAIWTEGTARLKALKEKLTKLYPEQVAAREKSLEASGKRAGGAALAGERTPPESGKEPGVDILDTGEAQPRMFGESPTGTVPPPKKKPRKKPGAEGEL
jgi:hypothetical protein